ncbi:protein of unknown function [Cupriavidus taiwanensis]|uniref:Uncharacterized protein n=1 Tax=Cupriavidus taiwanensis TaxID=164546 RepID=A0A7Z7NMT5_9BURK|nr:protein of unknown function [Cupriavidus taiwanensis]SOZ02961.1 hypothetical protein CBM2597_A110025 [Cupriavidus taiwanensis]SOZ06237.1 hypothetical protein CBM2595_A80922 [Cupriavidus taiwanensis]SPC18766.1 hypothetical protein CBM2594_A80205 [Cupriavidus taiwanensis]SPD41130.1 protein of unknown function [Cupriavidus taiwanensis]
MMIIYFQADEIVTLCQNEIVP